MVQTTRDFRVYMLSSFEAKESIRNFFASKLYRCGALQAVRVRVAPHVVTDTQRRKAEIVRGVRRAIGRRDRNV